MKTPVPKSPFSNIADLHSFILLRLRKNSGTGVSL